MLALGGLVGADIGVGRGDAEVGDMAQQMPHRVLRAGVAEIGADAPIGGRAVGDRPVLHRDAAQQDKAAAVEDLAAEPVEGRPQRRQREIGAGDLADVEPAGAHGFRRGLDLGELGRRQRVDPVLRPLAQVGADPGRRAFDQGTGWGERHDQVLGVAG